MNKDDWGYLFDKFTQAGFVADRSFRGADNVIVKGDEAGYFGWG
jgi:hypothetical protein